MSQPPAAGTGAKASEPPPSSLSPISRRGHARYTHPDLLVYLRRERRRLASTAGFAAFYEGLDLIAQDRCGRLWAAVRLIAEGNPDDGAREAETVVRGLPDEDDAPGTMAARTFAEAILSRARGSVSGGGNLYLGARPPGAQLRAFELLRLRTPLIPFAYAAANRALLAAVPEPAEVTLVDVGIGRGGQIRALLRNPSARDLLRTLHVIGVEPDSSADTGGALELAEHNIRLAAAEARIPVTFHGIAKVAESLSAEDVLAARPRGLLLANACLSLHHVGLLAHGAAQDRTGVLAALHRAGCQHVVLVEPDSDHDEDDLVLRFLHAYRHYGTLAESLGSVLSPGDAALVWGEFFASEVRNVITHDGVARVERHEPSSVWADRLAEVGFTVDTPPDLVPQAAAPPGFTVEHRPSVCSLRYGNVSVLGVLRGQRA